MWRPTTEAEILAALGGFTETAFLEAKEKIPKGLDVAKQVAAMATDGGTIVYGIAEEHGVFSRSPFPLDGAELRITQAVDHHLRDRPPIRSWPVETDADPSIGYVVVAVEASPRAPHMVDGRFYGRSGPGNVVLDQGVVDLLYERRRSWEADAQAVTHPHFKNIRTPGIDLGVVVQPMQMDRRLRRRVWPHSTEANDMRNAIGRVTRTVPLAANDLDAFIGANITSGVDALSASFSEGSDVLLVRREGGVTLFHSDLSSAIWDGDNRTTSILDAPLARLTVHTIALAGDILRSASYTGPVAVGVRVTGAEGAVRAPASGIFLGRRPQIDTDRYQQATRVDARRLDEPGELAYELLSDFLEGVNPSCAELFAPPA